MALSPGTPKEKPAYEDSLRILPNWVDAFCEYAGELTLPSIFTTWTAISAIAAVLERRVYTRLDRDPIYPNLFVFFVSPPGGGKSRTVNRSTDIIRQVSRRFGDISVKVKLAPVDITKASLIDSLHQSTRLSLNDSLDSESSCLYLTADEFGASMSFLDSGLLSFLSAMYDGRPDWTEARRGRGAKPLVIPYPLMNILSGIQPAYLAQNVPDLAWSQGFLSRFVMIYAQGQRRNTIFGNMNPSMQNRDKLIRDLTTVFGLNGEVVITEAAQQSMDNFIFRREPPAHPRLTHYNARRPVLLAKLAIVASVARGNSMMISEEDAIKAADWMLEVEATMPLIFKNMQGSNDEMLLNEALYEMRARYKQNGFIDPSELVGFLSSRAKGHLVEHLIRLSFRRGDYQMVNGLIVPN